MPLDVVSVKTRLNKTTTADDAELQSMLDAAVSYYAQAVGPTAGRTLKFDGAPVLILPVNATAVTGITYDDGSTVAVADVDLDPDSGLLRYPFRRGTRNVSVSFTVTVPPHHEEAILADVAGLFSATQRGNSAGALPTTGYESGFEDRTTPVTLFPRIRALAASLSSIG